MNNNRNLKIEEVFSHAIKNHQEGKIDVAQDLYNQVLKINPNYSQALYNLGTIFIGLKKYQKAKEYYEKAIEINPSYADALNNLGTIFLNSQEYQKAKEYYEKAIEINPSYADAYYNLGLTYNKLKEFQKAKECYEKAIEINPNNTSALNNLSIIFIGLGDIQKAKDCYVKVLQIDPNNIYSINALSSLLSVYLFEYKSEVDKDSFKKLILFLFKKKNIKPSNIVKSAILILLSNNDTINLLKIINLESSLLTNEVLQNLLKEELFCLILQKAIIPDEFLEKLLTQLRYQILFTLDDTNKDILEEYFNFIISLAEQCWLNEFIYTQSDKEINYLNLLKNKIENDNSVNEIEIAILGCYMPLNKSKIIIEKLFNYKSTNILFNDLINVQIKEPLKEIELSKSIKSFGIIDDLVTKKVKEQYGENPYPRWRLTNQITPCNFFFFLNNEIKPNEINHNNKFNNPNVLIAGCGTGSHPISATQYKNANILAVDLSKSSLAYAKRKTEELGLKNIEYLQADILQLKKLDKKFDIIEASGVLHHMKNPVAGLKVLVDILEPHGYLKLGLYSELARKHVVETRKFIKNKNYKNTSKDINICRQDILSQKKDPLLQKVTKGKDFYTISSVRDLLFHIQEHRFTIPQISEVLKDLDLEFLGFIFNNLEIKNKYFNLFPDDKKNISLDNWHQFEKINPDTFKKMYQFYIKKK